MKIGLAYNERKKNLEEFIFDIKKWLENKKHQKVFIKPSGNVLKNLDFIVTFGGDGFVLHTANNVAEYKIPILRVNFGRTGFLTNVEPNNTISKLSEILDKKNYIIKKRTRIEVIAKNKKNEIVFIKDALNDIVIERIFTKVIVCNIFIDGKENEYRGDGIIFATRTGSSAYSWNVGGPALLREDRFIMRVISPSDIETMPFVIKPSSTTFIVKNIRGNSRLVADGVEISDTTNNFTFEIKKSPCETMFMEIGDADKIT